VFGIDLFNSKKIFPDFSGQSTDGRFN